MTVERRWTDLFFSRDACYALGWDGVVQRHYLSIPVANRATDYDEYYALSAVEFEALVADRAAARAFADRCRRRELDDRLILQPGTDRGYPIDPV